MARSFQHNAWLPLAEMPDLDEIKESLFRDEICDKRVYVRVKNPRYIDTPVQTILVTFESLQRDRHMPGLWHFGGDILRIDGEVWNPPANRFDLRYNTNHPANSGFMVINLALAAAKPTTPAFPNISH